MSDEHLPLLFVLPAVVLGVVLSGVTMVAFLGTMHAG
ncbi:MAG: hypothetical protein JWN67_4162 [Actinomycetia bacterium]|nr:hypothetical protein [Actinomycetes bacterium]